MSSPSRFARNNLSSSSSSSKPSPLALSPASSQSNLYSSSDPPLRRSRNLPSNPSPSSPSLNSKPYGSPSMSASPRAESRFKRDAGPRDPASPLRNASGVMRSPNARESHAQTHAMAQEQIIQDWNMPRKRGQTPVSEAKFYSQLEKVSSFMRMLVHKERESDQLNNITNNNYNYNNSYGRNSYANNNRFAMNGSGGINAQQQPPQQVQQQKIYPPFDLLMPDFEGKQNIVVRNDILTRTPESASVTGNASSDLITFSPQLVPPKGGRFGMGSNPNSPKLSNKSAVDLGDSFGMGGSSGMLYAPIQDNRKLKSNIVDVKYPSIMILHFHKV